MDLWAHALQGRAPRFPGLSTIVADDLLDRWSSAPSPSSLQKDLSPADENFSRYPSLRAADAAVRGHETDPSQMGRSFSLTFKCYFLVGAYAGFHHLSAE